MKTTTAALAGFISQRVTDPVAVHPEAPRHVNAGYKWHHSVHAAQGQSVSAGDDANIGQGVHIAVGRPGAPVLIDATGGKASGLPRDSLNALFIGARDATLPMLNFQNAVTVAKLVNVIANVEGETKSKSPVQWDLRDVCPIHGTTTVAFAQLFQQPLLRLQWYSGALSNAGRRAVEETPPRFDFHPRGKEGYRREHAYWPYLAALHGDVVADTILGGQAYVRAYPEYAGQLAGKTRSKMLQGDSLEKRVKRLGEVKLEIPPGDARVPALKVWEAVAQLAGIFEKAGPRLSDEETQGARSRIKFIVEAILTRKYGNRMCVEVVLRLVGLAFEYAKLPHGYDREVNRQSQEATRKALGVAFTKTGGVPPNNVTENLGGWSPEPFDKEEDDKHTHAANKAMHVTLDWDVHSEHARLNLRYLRDCFDKIGGRDNSQHHSALLSFALPRRFRTVKVDFSRRCSLSNYLFHHMRYFDINGADTSDDEDWLAPFHGWCSDDAFHSLLRTVFLSRGPSPDPVVMRYFPPSAKGGEIRAEQMVTLTNGSLDRCVFWADQGPLRFVCVYRPSSATRRAALLSDPFAAIALQMLRVITHREVVARADALPNTKRVDTKTTAVVSDVSDIVQTSAEQTRLLMLVLHRVFSTTADPKKADEDDLRQIRGSVAALRDAMAFAYSASTGADHKKQSAQLRAAFEELQLLHDVYMANNEKDVVMHKDFFQTAQARLREILRLRMILAMARPGSKRDATPGSGSGRRVPGKSTHGGFWASEQASRDRTSLVPNPLYKFKARRPLISLDALSLDIPESMLSLPVGPMVADDARKMADLYRRYTFQQHAVTRRWDAALSRTLLDATRFDEDRSTLSYANTKHLAALCRNALSDTFTGDVKALKDKVDRSWSFPWVKSKGSDAAIAPLWVVFRPGYGSATLALHESGFRVTELSPKDDLHEGGDARTRVTHPPPMFSIGRSFESAKRVPSSKTVLIRMAILTAETRDHTTVSIEEDYAGPLSLASEKHISSLFLDFTDERKLSDDLKRLLKPVSSSFILWHMRISNYDAMAEGIAAPEFDARDRWALTQVVEYVCKGGIRKIIIVPVPTESHGPCDPFYGTLAIPEGSLKCIRVHIQSFDLLFIFTGTSPHTDMGPIQADLQRTSDRQKGLNTL